MAEANSSCAEHLHKRRSQCSGREVWMLWEGAQPLAYIVSLERRDERVKPMLRGEEQAFQKQPLENEGAERVG